MTDFATKYRCVYVRIFSDGLIIPLMNKSIFKILSIAGAMVQDVFPRLVCAVFRTASETLFGNQLLASVSVH